MVQGTFLVRDTFWCARNFFARGTFYARGISLCEALLVRGTFQGTPLAKFDRTKCLLSKRASVRMTFGESNWMRTTLGEVSRCESLLGEVIRCESLWEGGIMPRHFPAPSRTFFAPAFGRPHFAPGGGWGGSGSSQHTHSLPKSGFSK